MAQYAMSSQVMIFAFLLILSLIMFFTTAYHETFSCPSIVRLLLVASNNPIQTCLRKRKRIRGYLGAFLRTRDLRNGLRPGKECHCGGDGLSLSGPLVTASLENWLPLFRLCLAPSASQGTCDRAGPMTATALSIPRSSPAGPDLQRKGLQLEQSTEASRAKSSCGCQLQTVGKEQWGGSQEMSQQEGAGQTM